MKRKMTKVLSLLMAVSMSAALPVVAAAEEPAEKHINAALAYMEPGLDPSNGTYGWVTIRMGVTECLVRMNDAIEIEPWIASEVKNIDELTWEITIRDGVTFSNGTAVTVLEVKDYIRNPKENGYRSLHLILEIPIFLSDEKKNMKVEVQFRTIAMDFWASLEHKLKYKKNIVNPEEVSEELKACAEASAALDLRMQALRDHIEMEQHC